jgi:hypothetical protein
MSTYCPKHTSILARHGDVNYKPLSLLERFKIKMSKKTSTGCIEWLGNKNTHGYGCLSIKNKTESAHRISFELFVGTVTENMCVLHKCDNRKCVNPDHLFLGTAKDNAVDRSMKGRNYDQKGSRHPASKFTEEQIKLIRNLHEKGKSQAEIARKFNATPGNIYNIISRKTWIHV